MVGNMIHYLKREHIIAALLGQVWDFFVDPRNLNDIIPADLNFKIISGGEQRMFAGQLIENRVKFVREPRVGPYLFLCLGYFLRPGRLA